MVNGDPHLTLGHGGHADFRGRHGAIFNFLSARNLSINVRTTNASFYLRDNSTGYKEIRVDGTFITEVYIVGRTSLGRFLNLSFGDGKTDRIKSLGSLRNLRHVRSRRQLRRLSQQLASPPEVVEAIDQGLNASCALDATQGPQSLMLERKLQLTLLGAQPWLRGSCDELKVDLTDGKRYGGKVGVHITKMTLTTPEWRLVAENKPVFNWITGANRRLDLSLELMISEAKLPTMPHGILGQSWDGDGRATDGQVDVYPKVEGAHLTTSAMAEGAIEGTPKDYEMPTPYEVRYRYSRFGTLGIPARSLAGLNVRSKQTSAKSFMAGATERAE